MVAYDQVIVFASDVSEIFDRAFNGVRDNYIELLWVSGFGEIFIACHRIASPGSFMIHTFPRFAPYAGKTPAWVPSIANQILLPVRASAESTPAPAQPIFCVHVNIFWIWVSHSPLALPNKFIMLIFEYERPTQPLLLDPQVQDITDLFLVLLQEFLGHNDSIFANGFN